MVWCERDFVVIVRSVACASRLEGVYAIPPVGYLCIRRGISDVGVWDDACDLDVVGDGNVCCPRGHAREQ